MENNWDSDEDLDEEEWEIRQESLNQIENFAKFLRK